MPQDTPALHVYERADLGEDNDSLTLLARHIEAGAVVLDLGMGTGGLGKYLAARQSITLDGVTLSDEEAQRAGPAYRQVVVADLDSADLTQLFAGRRYDRIVCADVLEHLKNPERILQQCQLLLQPGGQLLTSVPNVAYCGLLAELLQGEFEYRPEGLLDNTHLRFFTRQSLHRFFAQHGWQVKTSENTTRNVLASEFKGEFNLLPPAVARHLLALPDAATYQFISCLEPQPPGEKFTAAEVPKPTSALPLFSAQMYLSVDGNFDEARKEVCPGSMGGDVQTLRFSLHSLTQGRYTCVRLDPADRPGYMRILRLSITCPGPQKILWTWLPTSDFTPLLANAAHHQIIGANAKDSGDPDWFLLEGDDPWIELSLDPTALAALSEYGGQLEMLCSWPMSADYIQANKNLQVTQGELRLLSLELAAADQLRLEAAKLQAEILSRKKAKADLKLRLQEESLKTVQLRHDLAQSERQRLELNDHLNNARQYIARVENSKIFKATRPLAQLKYTLDGWLGRRSSDAAPALALSKKHHIPLPQADQFSPLPRPDTVVDVIIPVYRGLEDTQRSVLSVLASPCQTAWHLVVINDCSPEPEVTHWLRELAAQEPLITLLENEENLGFVATVNRGMRLHPDRDVLLLNSDTEVANDWLDRIQRAAYSRPQVASVTPFSNNATICSYPRFCQANDLPAGHTTTSLDQLFATHLAGHAVEVPTGVGFCMYIRRACLQTIGDFDEAHFGKGYGEENDFCIRAQKAGWVNLHALDTFVRHVGGISFGDTKSERELNAMRTLAQLHPRYDSDVHQFIGRDPAQWARRVVDLARITCSDKPVILNVTHNREGGTLRHLQEMGQHLATHATFLRLSPAPGGVVLRLEGACDDLLLHFNFPQDQARLVRTLQDLQVAHIHFHHLLGHDPLVSQLPTLLGLAHDFTLHDYHSYCPQISLTDETHRYCGEQGIEQCRQCVRRNPAPGGLGIETWRALHTPLLAKARTVISPSADAGQRLLKHVPLAPLQVVPHARLLVQTPPRPTPRPKRLEPTQALKIVVLGGLSQIKGADVVEALALLAAKNNIPLDIHLLGFGYRQLRTQPKARLTVHGPYADADLPPLLDWLQADVAWFPALWPETYSYTLSACLEKGLPVVAPTLGAFAERLAQRPWSWLCDWQQTPTQWASFFEQIRQENFITGQGPTPPALLADTLLPSPMGHDFDYRLHYLQGLRAPTPPSTEHLGQLALAICQAPSAATSPTKTGKSLALSALQKLKGSSLLAPLVKTLPLHLQRRIKSMLLR